MKTRKWTKSSGFQEIVKFIFVGAINTAIDLAVLNLLILVFHTGKFGTVYGFFKGVSFLCAVANSYVMNKYWTFKTAPKRKAHIQISQFMAVSLVGLGLNVVVATSFVSSVRPAVGYEAFWPTIGALIGTAAGLIWNYFGYKFIVFGKRDQELLPPA